MLVQNFVRQGVFSGAPQRARHDHPILRADHQSAGDLHQRCAARVLQLAPQLVRALNERDIQRVLEISLPNDPAVTMRRTQRVPGSELLETEHPHPSAREMKQCSAPHRAEADHDDFVATLLSHGR